MKKKKNVFFKNKKRRTEISKKETTSTNEQNLKFVGTFVKSKNFGFVIPDNKKANTDVFVSKSNSKKVKNNQKVVVEIIKNAVKGKNAEGKIVEVIGSIDRPEIDILSVIKEHGVSYKFPEIVTKKADTIPDSIDENNIKYRVDLRNIEVFTIDGEDAKDLDDGVSIEKTKNGTYILGVHIADVSHYVTENSLIDKEALNRGTSIYMLDKVVPMLPKNLSNGICSLNEGVDRFTISTKMEIDKDGNVISFDVFKAVIKVTKRMTYTNVTKILENSDKKVILEYKKYIDKFKIMEELADILIKKRKIAGNLDLNIPESKIILNEEGKIVDIKNYEVTKANGIIEQFMVLANEQIAEKFYFLKAPFIYRVHEEPDIERVKELNKLLFDFGYKIKITKDTIFVAEFAKVLESIKGKEEEKALSTLILRTLKLAIYESENKGHFGLASKYYCHFTSPIRRYPDLFIHRMISMYLRNNYNISNDVIEKYKNQATKYAEISTDREKIAVLCEREIEAIKKAEYMADKIGEEFEGIISSTTSFGVFVELPNTVEGLIRFENLGNDYYIYDEEHKTLLGEKTKELYKIGDKIKVQLIEADKNLRRISFKKI
ncbi:MAG: ribonuclease R [Lachnospiraceae bacterium]|jgi:ribonuclease R|nr:ribonuclease R [Lachnospiraceae bacterium]